MAGLTAGIRLTEGGRKVAILSAGHSSLHFNAGAFGLLGFDRNHAPVSRPLDEIANLPAEHPYRKIAADALPSLAEEAKALLTRAGVKCSGSALENHTRISPLGVMCPAWLSIEGMATLDALRKLETPHVAIMGIAGFLDFYPRFIAAALEREGLQCDILTVDNADLRALRHSTTEMRASNIARMMHGDALVRFADAIGMEATGSDAAALIIPAVVDADASELSQIVGHKMLFAPTMGISVPGIAMHSRLTRHFLNSGGRIFNGHKAAGADFEGNRLCAIYTDKLDGDALRADNFILASGSFFGRGLVATPDEVREPIFGLDTTAPADRDDWFTPDLFGVQPVMNAGVAVDDSFRGLHGGVAVDNLYVAGAALAGADSLRNDSGGGVALLSALAVAHNILSD